MVEITVLQRDGVRITQSDEILQRLRRIQSLEPVMSAALEPLPADLKLVTAADLRPKPPMGFLYDYIRAAGWIAELHNSTDKTARGTSAKPSKGEFGFCIDRSRRATGGTRRAIGGNPSGGGGVQGWQPGGRGLRKAVRTPKKTPQKSK